MSSRDEILEQWAMYSNGGRLKSAAMRPDCDRSDEGNDYAGQCYWYVERFLSQSLHDAAFRRLLSRRFWEMLPLDEWEPRAEIGKGGILPAREYAAWKAMGVGHAVAAWWEFDERFEKWLAQNAPPTRAYVPIDGGEAVGGQWLTVREAASIVGVNIHAVYRKIERSTISNIEQGGRRLVSYDDVMKWAEKRQKVAA